MTYRHAELKEPPCPTFWNRVKKTRVYTWFYKIWRKYSEGMKFIIAFCALCALCCFLIAAPIVYSSARQNAQCDLYAAPNARAWARRIYPGTAVHIESRGHHNTFDVFLPAQTMPLSISCECAPDKTCGVYHPNSPSN